MAWINDDACGTYNPNSQIKFKTSMLKPSLCDYSDAHTPVIENTTVEALPAAGKNNHIQVVFKNCAPFIDCITEISNTQRDNAKDVNVVMPICNLIKYSNYYSKTSGSIWQYYRDKAALNDAVNLVDFPSSNASFKFTQKITGATNASGTINVEKMVPLKYLSNFWRTPEINLILT